MIAIFRQPLISLVFHVNAVCGIIVALAIILQERLIRDAEVTATIDRNNLSHILENLSRCLCKI